MSRWIGICALSLFLASSLSLSAESTRKPGSADLKKFSLTVYYGEKTTRFEVEAAQKGLLLKVFSNDSMIRKIHLEPKDSDFLLLKAEKAAGHIEADSSCTRNWIELNARIGDQNRSASACLQAQSVTGKELTSLANLLSSI